VLEGFVGPVIEWADGFGLLGLAVVSATEAAFQPVPPDLIVLPMALESDGFLDSLIIFLVATISSVIGSLGGYAIGLFGGRPVIERFAKPSNSRRLDELIRRYGDVGVFLAAVSPIPYKMLAWTAGAGRMQIRTFVFAGLIGRGIRFGMEVAVLSLWGNEFLETLEKPLFWIIVGLISVAAFLPLNSWWRDLDAPLESKN
jgi:undecaprenyl-diphosphatase|tara:strand:+ start:4377 stop:4976 length:600 start_codon:yes stop_codon:yes gene_type:complete